MRAVSALQLGLGRHSRITSSSREVSLAVRNLMMEGKDERRRERDRDRDVGWLDGWQCANDRN